MERKRWGGETESGRTHMQRDEKLTWTGKRGNQEKEAVEKNWDS